MPKPKLTICRGGAFILSLLLGFTPAGAGEAPAGAIQLDLQSFLKKAEQSDLRFQEILMDKMQSKYRRDLILPNRQLLLSVRDQYGFATGDGATTHTLSTSAEKTFPQTGTTLSAGYTTNAQEDRNEQTASLIVRQDLWKNAFGRQVQLLTDQLDHEEQALLLQITEAYEDHTEELIQQYLDLRLAYLNVEAAKELYQDSLTLQRNIEQRRRSNIAAQVDVDRIALQALSRKQEILESEATLRELSEQLAATLSPEKPQIILPQTPAEFTQREIRFDDVIESFLASSRSAELRRLQDQSRDIEIDYYRAELNPSLSLLAGYQYDNSQRFSQQVDRSETLLGVTFEWAFDDTRAQAELKQAQFAQAKTDISQKLFFQEFKSQALGLKSRLEQQRQLVQLLTEKLKLSRRIVRAVRERYQIGRSDLDTLISAQNELAQTRFAQLREEIRLNKHIVEWLSLTDQLVQEKSILQ